MSSQTRSAPFRSEDIVGFSCRTLSSMGSEIRRVFLLGQKLREENPAIDLVDLSLGNPDLEPPTEVREELVRLAQEHVAGAHRYMDNAGYPEVREFLASTLQKSEGVALTRDSVFLTCGAAGALQILLRTLLDPGDEVILLAPFFSEYRPYVSNMGGVPVIVGSDSNHLPYLSQLKAALSPRTRAIIVNSPNNPSGALYPESVLLEIADTLNRFYSETGRLVHLISDEPYARLLFNPAELVPILKIYPAAWLVRSHSKDLGLAGERIGYLAWGPQLALPETLNALRNSARALGFVNAPALMQRLLPRVFSASVDVLQYKQRVDAFVDILLAGGLECTRPRASFFVFPRSPLGDDNAFTERLLGEGVLAVPGSSFGKPGYFRCSLTQPLERVIEGAHRIVRAAQFKSAK
ncbi:MAG: pyridoxal phosphate-dependent aminotransferase [Betaproteobacteria bacterium]|nr:pyridoxal phosphate-dependent aminotransferase [Betaproteobacteria bacterium]